MQYAEYSGFAVFARICKSLQNVLLGEIFLHPRIRLRGGGRCDLDRLGGRIFALLVPLLIAELLIDRGAAGKNTRAEHRGDAKKAHASRSASHTNGFDNWPSKHSLDLHGVKHGENYAPKEGAMALRYRPHGVTAKFQCNARLDAVCRVFECGTPDRWR